jgi:hypothetical protein
VTEFSPSGMNADSDIPVLKEAKAEYAKMQQQEKVLPRRFLFADYREVVRLW